MSDFKPAANNREAAILEAGSLASSDRWRDARAVYLWVLARYADDPEALFGLARLDSWGGCYGLAEREYLGVLASHPEDSDVRAGYVDLLLWDGQFAQAERVLRRGLMLDANAPALLQREARMAYWSGDATEAVSLADRAERAAPDDGDVRAERDRLFLGEGRITVRVDRYPAGYQDLDTYGAQALQRLRRFDFYAGAEIVERYGGAALPTVVDVHYPVGAAYHPSRGVTLGAEVEPGAPATAIADLALKAWAQSPVVYRLDAFLSYQLWHFALGPEVVQILNPALGLALPHDLRLEGRAWVSRVSLSGTSSRPGSSRIVGAGGFQLSWQPVPRVGVGIAGTYGVELDQNPTLVQLLNYTAYSGSGFADWLVTRHLGIRPTVGLAAREAPDGTVIGILSVEVGAYARW